MTVPSDEKTVQRLTTKHYSPKIILLLIETHMPLIMCSLTMFKLNDIKQNYYLLSHNPYTNHS